MPPSAHDMRPQSSPAPAAPPRHRDPFLLSRVLLITGLFGSAVLLFDRIIRDVANNLAESADGSVLSSLAGSPSGLLEIHGPMLAILLVIALGGLVGVLHFVGARRHEIETRGDELIIREKRPWAQVRDDLAVRTGCSAILLYGLFILVQQLQAMSMGLHFSVGSTLLALPPIVSIGYALLVGFIVAATSLVGTATITRLRILLAKVLKRTIRVLRTLPCFPSDERIDLARLASAISSRGPPSLGRLAGAPTLA